MRYIPSKKEFRIPCGLASLPLALHYTAPSPVEQLFRLCPVPTCARTHRQLSQGTEYHSSFLPGLQIHVELCKALQRECHGVAAHRDLGVCLLR